MSVHNTTLFFFNVSVERAIVSANSGPTCCSFVQDVQCLRLGFRRVLQSLWLVLHSSRRHQHWDVLTDLRGAHQGYAFQKGTWLSRMRDCCGDYFFSHSHLRVYCSWKSSPMRQPSPSSQTCWTHCWPFCVSMSWFTGLVVVSSGPRHCWFPKISWPSIWRKVSSPTFGQSTMKPRSIGFYLSRLLWPLISCLMNTTDCARPVTSKRCACFLFVFICCSLQVVAWFCCVFLLFLTVYYHSIICEELINAMHAPVCFYFRFLHSFLFVVLHLSRLWLFQLLYIQFVLNIPDWWRIS